MNAIIGHVWTPDELIHQGVRGIDSFTVDVVAQANAAEYLSRLSQQLFEAYRSPGDRHTLRV